MVNQSRALLQLAEGVTLQDGLKQLQGERDRAPSMVANVQQSLELGESTSDPVKAIQKAKLEAEQNKNERKAREKEISNAKALLHLLVTTSL